MNKLNKEAFNENAVIKFHGCKTACNKDLPFLQKNIAQSFANYFKGVKVTGFTGGAIKVQAPDAEIDSDYTHQKGADVWYKTWGFTRTYQKTNGKMIVTENENENL